MSDERPSPGPFEEKRLYGASVKKYEAGPLLYEVQGLRDGYGSDFRLGMTVSQEGDVWLVLKEQDPDKESLSIQFNASKKGTKTPNMAERLTRIPRTLFEKEGRWLDDDPEFTVSSLQEKLRIIKRDNSSQGSIHGIQGDGDQDTTMNLFIAETGDLTIQLIQMPTDSLPFRTAEMIFPSHVSTFYSGTLNEFREAAREIIGSQTPTTS